MQLQAWEGDLEPRGMRRQLVKEGHVAVEADLYQLQAGEGQFEISAHRP